LRSLRPPKLAVLLMRVIESMAESICSWLADRSSLELAPVLAASTMRALTELRRSLTSARAASVVAMTAAARSALLDALVDAVDVGADAFGDDEAGGVVLAAVDADAGGERSSRAPVPSGCVRGGTGDHARDVRVDA
jgi:hypothetical protein